MLLDSLARSLVDEWKNLSSNEKQPFRVCWPRSQAPLPRCCADQVPHAQQLRLQEQAAAGSAAHLICAGDGGGWTTLPCTKLAVCPSDRCRGCQHRVAGDLSPEDKVAKIMIDCGFKPTMLNTQLAGGDVDTSPDILWAGTVFHVVAEVDPKHRLRCRKGSL